MVMVAAAQADAWKDALEELEDIYDSNDLIWPISQDPDEWIDLGSTKRNTALGKVIKSLRKQMKAVGAKFGNISLDKSQGFAEGVTRLAEKLDGQTRAEKGDHNSRIREMNEAIEYAMLDLQASQVEAQLEAVKKQIEDQAAALEMGGAYNDYAGLLSSSPALAGIPADIALMSGGFPASAARFRNLYSTTGGQGVSMFGDQQHGQYQRAALDLAVATYVPTVIALTDTYGDLGQLVSEASPCSTNTLQGLKKFIPNGAYVVAAQVAGLSAGDVVSVFINATYNAADWSDDPSTDAAYATAAKSTAECSIANVGGQLIGRYVAGQDGFLVIDLCIRTSTVAIHCPNAGATVAWDVYASHDDAVRARGGINAFGRPIPAITPSYGQPSFGGISPLSLNALHKTPGMTLGSSSSPLSILG
jgi:hypothetical protein